MGTKGVSVIVPNYNCEDFIKQCLDSICSQKGLFLELIVIDDNSNDNSWFIINNYEIDNNLIKIIKIKNNQNIGYSGCCVLASLRCSFSIIVFMNCDAIFTKTNQLKKIINAFEEDGQIGAIGFHQINNDGSSQFIGSNVDIFLSINPDYIRTDYIEKKIQQNSSLYFSEEFIMVGGACFATKKDIYDSIGGIDKDYFLYVEELDYMWRVLLAGYKIVTLVSEPLIHLGGFSTKNQYNNTTNSRKIYYREKNTIMTIIKNYQAGTLVIVIPLLMVSHFIEIFYLFISKNAGVAMSYFKAYHDVLLNFSELIEKRKKVKSFRVINDSKLFCDNKIVFSYFKLKHVFKKGIPKFTR